MLFFKNRPNFPSGLKVLLIDCEAGARQQVVEQLTQLSYEVVPCPDADAACTAIAAAASRFDIILAEVSSLGSTAASTQRLLDGAAAVGLPLVLMGNSSGPAEVMKGIESGAVDFLDTPLSDLKLRNIWQHVVRKMMSAEVAGFWDVRDAPYLGKGMAPSMALSGDRDQSVLSAHSSKCFETDASSYLEVKIEEMAGLAGLTPEVALELLASPSHSLSCDGSKASTDSAAPYPFGSSKSLSGSGTPTGGLCATTRCRASKRLKSASANATAMIASPRMASQAQAWAAATAAPSETGVQRTTSLPCIPPSQWAQPLGGHHLPVACGAPASSFVQWQAPASVMVPVCETTLRAPASEAVGSPNELQLQRLSLDSAASVYCSAQLSTLGLDFDAADCNKMLEDCEASLSGDSMHSTFEELLLPDDLELDLMFGDSLSALPQPFLQRPPIGLSLRKSESLVNLINSHLSSGVTSIAGAC